MNINMNDLEKQNKFLELFEPMRSSLSGFCRALSKNTDDAKDLMSETILKTYENFEKIINPLAFKSYMFSIASRLNKRKNWRSRIFSILDFDSVPDVPSHDSLQDILPDVEYLYKMMKKLNMQEQEAIALFEISGFSIKEVAEIQNTGESTVKSRLKRGREKLIKLFSDNYNGFNVIDNLDKIVKIGNDEGPNNLEKKILRAYNE
jgi:RNA polymerase sigma-70 factor, ECF subfamily